MCPPPWPIDNNMTRPPVHVGSSIFFIFSVLHSWLCKLIINIGRLYFDQGSGKHDGQCFQMHAALDYG